VVGVGVVKNGPVGGLVVVGGATIVATG